MIYIYMHSPTCAASQWCHFRFLSSFLKGTGINTRLHPGEVHQNTGISPWGFSISNWNCFHQGILW